LRLKYFKFHELIFLPSDELFCITPFLVLRTKCILDPTPTATNPVCIHPGGFVAGGTYAQAPPSYYASPPKFCVSLTPSFRSLSMIVNDDAIMQFTSPKVSKQ
jgi:hypothetical protein